jgi:hypothetical protein
MIVDPIDDHRVSSAAVTRLSTVAAAIPECSLIRAADRDYLSHQPRKRAQLK